MKYLLKLHSINYERPNESTQHSQWNIKWKHTALIMKEAMNKCNLMNEIFIEIAQGWLWKVQWKHPKFWMKYLMKAHSINYEWVNEYT